jgi:putative transcriptional regulator
MLTITFEFVGGPNDGKVERGKLGEASDAERHYLFSRHGRIGQQFTVASDHTVEALAADEVKPGESLPRHEYVVTDRSEEGDMVWVRAEYVSNREKQPSGEPTDAPLDLDGYLLVASPRLENNFFAQSVILILHQDEEEALGVVLNRPADETVGRLWEQVSDAPCSNESPVHIGGPSDGPVLALHACADSGEVEVTPGVYLAVERDELEQVVHGDERPSRLFVGAARWDSGQLAQELAAGVWLTVPATQDLVFDAPDGQWRSALRRYGRLFLQSIGIHRVPQDPRVN